MQFINEFCDLYTSLASFGLMKSYIYAKYIYKVLPIKKCHLVIHMQELVLHNNYELNVMIELMVSSWFCAKPSTFNHILKVFTIPSTSVFYEKADFHHMCLIVLDDIVNLCLVPNTRSYLANMFSGIYKYSFVIRPYPLKSLANTLTIVWTCLMH